MGYNVVVVGATGNVGREMLNILAERAFPVDRIAALASRRSLGTEVSFGDKTLKTADLETFDFTGWDIAGYVLEGIVLLFVYSCSVCLHFYAAMAIGHSFNDHKGLLSVVSFFVLSAAMTMLAVVSASITGNSGLFDLVGNIFFNAIGYTGPVDPEIDSIVLRLNFSEFHLA